MKVNSEFLRRVAPARIGLAAAGKVWLDGHRDTVLIAAGDLQELSRKSSWARAANPNAEVLADIHAAVAHDAAAARAALAATTGDHTDGALLYVGTPPGLAGLISDLRVLGIVDGAVITPLTPDSVCELADEPPAAVGAP